MSTINTHTLERWISQFRTETNVVSDFETELAISDGENVSIFTDETVLAKYSVELSKYLVDVALNQREQEYYAYNPRLFAYDLYGIPEFWYLILYANELKTALDFKLKKVKFYNKGVTKVLNEIRSLEKDRINSNRQEMTDIVVNRSVVNNDINEDLFT